MAYNYLFKFVILGDKAVGKSSICNIIDNKTFTDYLAPTIGVEYIATYFNIDNKTIKCQFWDISGDSSYLTITESYLKDNIGVIIVFDKSNKTSFTNIKKWVDLLGDKTEQTKILLMGNKLDKVDIKVTNYEASVYANANNFLYIDTSAKTGENIIYGIEKLIRFILLNINLHNHPGIKEGYKEVDILQTQLKHDCCFDMCKFL